MRINTNILSLSAQRNLATTTRALARAMEKLASGYRINSARDDAAGLAISSGLEAQRRAMTQAIRNMNDARGFLNTADGALAEQTNIIQRMRELSLQSANGTLSAADRNYLDQEFKQLTNEFYRITDQTSFNGNNLFKGALDNLSLQVGTQKGNQISLQIERPDFQFPEETNSELSALGTYTLLDPSVNSASQTGAGLGDFDGDGDLDLATEYGAFTRSGTVFTQSQSWANTLDYILTGDFNGDGKVDLITSYFNTYLRLGNGNGTFQSNTTIATDPDTIINIDAGDIDGDGDLDLIASQSEGGVLLNSIYKNNGSGVFTLSSTFTNSTTALVGRFADIDNDNDLDIIGARNTVIGPNNFINDGTGIFSNAGTIGGTGGQIDVNDIDGDGNLDIVTRETSQISIQYGNGNGTFSSRVTLVTGSTTSGTEIKIADMNNDGLLDIITPNRSDATLSILINQGNRQFANHATTAAGTNPFNLLVLDLNDDGINDIISITQANGIRLHIQNTQEVEGTSTPDLTIETQSDAENMLDILDDTLAQLNGLRASIGAIQNRLDYAESNSRTMVENISAAKSQVLDTDYANEMAEFTRLQILQEAGLSVLSQANMNTKIALKLLQGL